MKLSEAIRLGAMTLPPAYGPVFRNGPDGKPCAACAIGAALYAMGRIDNAHRYMEIVSDLWPWTHVEVAIPLDGWSEIKCHMSAAIVLLFEREKWTREQIADWVETIERRAEATEQELSKDAAPSAVSA